MKKKYGPVRVFKIAGGIIVALSAFVSFTHSSAFALEKLEKNQMKKTTAQAGLSIGMAGVTVCQYSDSVRFVDSQTPAAGYVALENIKGLGLFETGATDIDNDGNAGHLSIDVGNAVNNESIITDDIPLVFLSCSDWSQNVNISVGNVNWCGKNIGSLDVKNFSLPSWHVYFGAYNGKGVDYQLGFKTKIEEIKFNYGSSNESLGVSGLQIAGSFNGAPESGCGISDGEFTVGDPFVSAGNPAPSPASIDIGVREDTVNGVAVSTPVIEMNLNAAGSVRADNIQFGAQSFGPMAIDGIKVHSMKIEIPGRGLGGS